MALKLIEPDSCNRITVLVIGGAGIGKTSLLKTIPEGENALTLSAEGGLLSVRDIVHSGRVMGFEITSIDDFKEALELLKTPEYKAKFQWVFVDSLTEISSRCLEAWKVKYPDKKDSFNLWGSYGDEIIILIKAFRDLAPYNVVFTCLPRAEKDADGVRYFAPAIKGGEAKDLLTSFFDLVFYYTKFSDNNGNPYRALVTDEIRQMPAKDRSGCLDLIEAPDLGAIRAKIIAGAPRSAEPQAAPEPIIDGVVEEDAETDPGNPEGEPPA
jgi:hypothetical protein